ncbi:MAG: hypothetical protein V2A34_06920, partial [Lentisphaerota bacterium]
MQTPDPIPPREDARRPGVLKTVALTFLVTTLVWAVFCWPLPRHLSDGITMSSRNIEKGHARTMIRGDHLQLLYHFWLFGDWIRGNSPFSKNVYEFNTGGDEDRTEAHPYFMPFCFLYAAGEFAAGRAFGWNFTVFMTLWLSYLFTVLLLLRYTNRSLAAYAAALISMLLPYRWLTLLGGSPTGFAMTCVPLLMLSM